MHKAKKSVKSGKIPKPIKIKKERTDEDRTLHPMSNYIDDRLELVKQVFGSLKPKTITNLAPDFLKKKNMDEIEELCLNELLGISTKRLLSIINATKCPTDTESSSDSDVEQHKEHVSLEEISSDSEIDGGTANAGKRKSSGTKGKAVAKKATEKSAESEELNGQISVLELLELQARARAIRSQLALEPVTKIEVDSDGEKKETKTHSQKSSFTNGIDPKEYKHKRAHKTSEKSKEVDKPQTSSTSLVRTSHKETNTKVKGNAVDIHSTRSNHLKRSHHDKNHEADKSYSEKRNKLIYNERYPVPLLNVKIEVKKEPRSHSPTPDVIPIIPEPETLCITDSSEGENHGTGKKKARKTENISNNSGETRQNDAPKAEKEKSTKERKTTEKEEGELRESSVEKDNRKDDNKKANNETKKDVLESNTETAKVMQETSKPEKVANTTEKDLEELSKKERKRTESMENTSQKAVPTADKETSKNPSSSAQPPPPKPVQPTNPAPNLEDEDDRNDDVISLGGDLEKEMIEHLEEDGNKKSSFASSSKKDNNTAREERDSDVISLDSSETEDERDKKDSESWHSRYLKSSKVSKVLATSRLGKRMRDNIKMSKRSKKDSELVKEPEEKEKSNTSYTSKHEDGSIEQYKELQAMRARKKQSNST